MADAIVELAYTTETMSPAKVLLALAFLPAVALADDIRLNKLEQDVLELQRTVRQQERQIETLQRELSDARALLAAGNTLPAARAAAGSSAAASAAAARAANPGLPWLVDANWDRVRVGMSELDVIGILGTPNTLRTATDTQRKTIYYALEFEGGGFLSGSVTIADQRVVAIERPTLK
jgi:hypothetical protein